MYSMDYQVEEGVVGNISKSEWLTYKEYLILVKDGYKDFKSFTYQRPHMKGVHLRTMAVKALEKANIVSNDVGGSKIYHLWDRLNLAHHIGAYADFVDDPDTEYLWRRYITDETLKRSMFRDVDLIKLTEIIVNKMIYSRRLVSKGYLETYFAFHNEFDLHGEIRFDLSTREDNMEDEEVELQARRLFEENIPQGLVHSWRFLLPSPTKIRNYFGEKIAFYFHFLNFLVVMLIPPAIVGIVAFTLQVVYADDNEGTEKDVFDTTNAVFAAFIVMWAAGFYEWWKQQEVKYSVIWGQTDFEEDQVERVDFHGVFRRSPVDDAREQYFSAWQRLLRIWVSTLVTLFMVGVVVGVIVGLFELRQYLFEEWQGKWQEDYIATLIATINAIQIQIFNTIFNYVAITMTRFENHKTQTVFEQSLITKTFIFRFVNSFNSLFYIAFIKRGEEGCIDEDSTGTLTVSKDNKCFRELYTQLRSIFIIAILLNVVELGLPVLSNWMAGRKKSQYYEKAKERGTDRDKLLVRIEVNMDKGVYAFQEIDGTYWDYMEIMIQMGYILLFGLCFPI
jgi:anoctamin-10